MGAMERKSVSEQIPGYVLDIFELKVKKFENSVFRS